ncbi:MAG: hypothetical protein AB8G15_21990 [Saprospiraceae bacterium]
MDTSITHIRPRFSIAVPHTQEKLMDRIEQLLKHTPDGIHGYIVGTHIILDVVGEDVHYWSPQLNFRVESNDENANHAVVSGLIGPRPPVWTLFVFIYFSVGITGFFVSSYGFSKLLLGSYSHFLLAFPIAIIFMLTAYRVGKYGESLAKDQMEILKQFVRDAIAIEQPS